MKDRPRRALLGLALLLLGCSTAVAHCSSPAPSAARPPRISSTASGATAPTPPRSLSLEEFSPFSTEPRLRSVAALLEEEQPRKAAEALELALQNDASLAGPSVAYWLGRLWERASEPEKARKACAEARLPDSLLRDYAKLCWARNSLALGDAAAVLKELSEPSLAPVELEQRLLVARALRKNADTAGAFAAFRALLELSPEGAGRARVALEFAQYLLEPSSELSARAPEALALVRRARPSLIASRSERSQLDELEQRALASLPPALRTTLAEPTLDERVRSMASLVDAREFELAERDASALLASLGEGERATAAACDARLLDARALAGLRRFSDALDALAPARELCSADADRGARIFFLSGRYASSAGRPTQAIGFFDEVERRFPENSLADDARLSAALAEEERGVEARFTELLLTLPDLYPRGDMAAEALFRLALRDLERGNWSNALGPLDRALGIVGGSEATRGFELSGRERYFRARALLALGKREDGLRELEQLLSASPLSYYMLNAYSLLEREAPGRAATLMAEAERESMAAPFRIALGSELSSPGFLRMLELLRVGELDAAVRELDALGLRKAGLASDILWGVALIYEAAGFTKFSNELTRLGLREIVGRWPFGQWVKPWQIAFPRPFLEIVQREARASGVDPALVYAVMREESAFDPDAVSPANAYGLMQLIVPTARQLAKSANLPYGPSALKRPRINVALGCRELARLGGLFPENPLLVVPAYNAGPGRPRAWLKERPTLDFDIWVERIPFLETRRYTKRVLSSRAVYAFLYERETAASRLAFPHKAAGASGEALPSPH